MPGRHGTRSFPRFEPIRSTYVVGALAFLLFLIPALPASANTAPAPAPASAKTLEAIDTSAVMWKYNVKNGTLDGRTEVPQEPYFGTAFTGSTAQLIETDWDGDGVLDLVTRLTSGHLILHAGYADNVGDKYRYAYRGIIGYGGWQTYDINAVKLRKTDKYPGLIARDNASGNLYYYPNTTGRHLYEPRIHIGFGGWTPMSEISAMDWDADGNMDLIVRNPQGELKLYRTDGEGNILNETRPTVDFGWDIMDHLAIEHDFAGPGTVGIIARNGNGYLFYYPISNGKVQLATTIGYGGWSGYKIAAGTP